MIKESLISVAGLLGRPVIHKGGQEVGRLVDLVFRWDTQQQYPPLAGLLVKVGRRVVWIGSRDVDTVTRRGINLGTAKLDLRDFQPREGEARLAKDVLDHQLVDINGSRVVRASDLFVATFGGVLHLVGVDVGYQALLRRLGPAALRSTPAPTAVIDWAAVQSFGLQSGTGRGLRLSTARSELKRMRPAELADLLEDLGRTERQELLGALTPDQVADALEEMQPDELEAVLRESAPQEAAKYLAKMEPDEAADALRDIDQELREDLLARMPGRSAKKVQGVLSYEEGTAGGFMTTTLITAQPNETVESLQGRLRGKADDYREVDSVVLLDKQGQLLNDLPIIDIFLAQPSRRLSELVLEAEPVPVHTDATLPEVAELLIANRRSSVLVVDADNHPVGRILADDVVDAMLPERGRLHFPRILSS